MDSFIEYMQWQKNVKDNFKDMYPDYHISFEFKLEKNHKNPLFRKILNKHINYINVFVPHYVIRDELDKIYEEMKPLLKKHKVDRITFFKTGTNEMLEEIIKNENLVYNVYSKNKNIIWEKYYDYIFNCDDVIPKCECGGRIRPDVTLYGEKLPKKAWDMAIKTISKADMLIVAGTSLTVYPAASLVSEFRGKYIAVINKGGVDKNKVFADIIIDDDMTKVFEKITELRTQALALPNDYKLLGQKLELDSQIKDLMKKHLMIIALLLISLSAIGQDRFLDSYSIHGQSGWVLPTNDFVKGNNTQQTPISLLLYTSFFLYTYLLGLKFINPEYTPIGVFPFCTGCAAPLGVKAAPSIIFICGALLGKSNLLSDHVPKVN